MCRGRDDHARGAAEILHERAVEDDEARLVGVGVATARPTPEHLLEEDARADRPQEDEELQIMPRHMMWALPIFW